MRKVNAFLGVIMLVLVLIHGIAGGYQMAGIIPGGDAFLSACAWVLFAVLIIHAAIGLMLTIETIKKARASGTFYWKENLGFIVRRASGFLMLVFAAIHIAIFIGKGSGASARLTLFGGPELILSMLLALCLIIHILSNIRPLFIALGIGGKGIRKDAAVIFLVILIFCMAMFAFYYYRWNTAWKV